MTLYDKKYNRYALGAKQRRCGVSVKRCHRYVWVGTPGWGSWLGDSSGASKLGSLSLSQIGLYCSHHVFWGFPLLLPIRL